MSITSPLTRDIRDSFQPKIVELYKELFSESGQYYDDGVLPTNGFWVEFFLLQPSKSDLVEVLENAHPSFLLRNRAVCHDFVVQCLSVLTAQQSQQLYNAIDTLTIFVAVVLNKRFANPTTDLLQIIANLDEVDHVINSLVASCRTLIGKNGDMSSYRAAKLELATLSGSFRSSIPTYFMQPDLFNPLVKLSQVDPLAITPVICALGLLANYNKFEAQNIYQSLMTDHINETAMVQLVGSISLTCSQIRDEYIHVQQDLPEAWSFTSTLSYIGLRALTSDAKKPPAPSEDELKQQFGILPTFSAATLLTAYTCCRSNRHFAGMLLSTSTSQPTGDSPLACLLSATSYLCHHAYRGQRPSHYAMLCLLLIRTIFNDIQSIKVVSAVDNNIQLRLARHTPPHLPLVTSARPPISALLDILVDTLSHNLRKKLDLKFYNITLLNLHHIVTRLHESLTRLVHHWTYVWSALSSLLRFLTTQSASLIAFHRITDIQILVCTPLLSILAFSILHADIFLPDPKSYDDLFYKLTELSDIFPRFEEAYKIDRLPNTSPLHRATGVLKKISIHYHGLITTSGKSTHSSSEVQKLIGQGHESASELLSETSRSRPGGRIEFGYYEDFKENDWRFELKKIIRTCVEDARQLSLL